MTRKSVLCTASLAAIAAATTWTTAAHAQAARVQTAQAPSGVAVEELVVTARMREESLQETPVAVTAVTQAQIQRMFVRDLTSMTRVAPNFTVEGVGAIHRNASVAYSRGVGYQGVDQAIDPSVGIAVDGVFYTRNIGALQNMFDVDRVEILRGPQGTLFGKNTTAGVINVITKEPGDRYAIEAMGRIGNYGRADYAASIDLPINEKLAFRISGAAQHSDGYMHNLYRTPQGVAPVDTWLSGDDVKSIRGAMKWLPMDNLKVNLSVSWIKDRSDSVGGVNGSFPTDLLSKLLGHPGYGFPGGPTNPFVSLRNFPSGDYQDTFGSTLHLTYEGQGYRIVSITGYLHDKNFSYNDFDDSPLAFFETTSGQKHEQTSEELRIESNSNSPLQGVAGIYLGHVGWDAWQIFYLSSVTEEGSHQYEDDAAVFAQVDYKVLPQLTLTAGGRYSKIKKKFWREQQVLTTIFPQPAIQASKDWSQFTYHLGAEYRFTDDLMAYASYSTGFKSGGFNSRAASAATIGPFAPEKAKAWEVGVKSEWFDHRLRANVSAFWNKYNDLQVSVFQPAANGSGEQQVVANNANERARGVEVELTAVPIPKALITASVGYLDASYTSFVANLTGLPANPATPCTGVHDYAQNGPCHLIPTRVPKWTTHVEASYEYDLPEGWGSLTPSVAWSLEGSHFTDTTNAPQGYQHTYNIWDASLNYDDPTHRWRLSLWGKNLGNVAHKLSTVPTAGLLTQLYFAEPKLYGVELRVKFGE